MRLLAYIAVLIAFSRCGMPDQHTAPYDMTTPITPASPPTIATTISVPSDGEVANSLSLQLFVQPLENSAEAFRLLTYGGGIRRRVSCTSNTVMVIQPLGAVVVTAASVWTVYQNTASSTTINPTTLSGGLVASTRYWVYATTVTGALGFVVNTTGPDAGLKYSSATTDQMYVSTFWVDSAGNIVLYTQADADFKFTSRTWNDAVGVSTTLLSGGNAGVATQIVLNTTVFPSQASSYHLLAGSNSSAAAGYAYVTKHGVASDIYTTMYSPVIGLGFSNQTEIDVPGVTSVDYLTSAATTTLTLLAGGFTL